MAETQRVERTRAAGPTLPVVWDSYNILSFPTARLSLPPSSLFSFPSSSLTMSVDREYELTVRQEPKQARMCGIGGKGALSLFFHSFIL